MQCRGGITRAGTAAPFRIMLFEIGVASLRKRSFIASQVNHQAVWPIPGHVAFAFRIEMLSHFQTVYRSYFDRSELHRLHNRSRELWSPRVALAAFFEEQGGIVGLASDYQSRRRTLDIRLGQPISMRLIR